MSLSLKISRIERLLRERPALANVPVAVVDGRTVTLAEALEMLRAGRTEVLAALQRMGLDDEDTWKLAEALFERLYAAAPGVKIYFLSEFLPTEMSLEEALEHIRKRDEIGYRLMMMYKRLLNFIRANINT